MKSYILLLLALVFIWLEFYLPGGTMAVAGAFFLIAACTTYIISSGSLYWSIFFVVLSIALVIGVIRLAIYRIQRSKDKNTFFLSKDQEGYKAATFDVKLIGQKGITLTDLGPSGYVLIGQKRYAAICRGPYVDKGKEIIVITGQVDHLVVKPLV